MEFLNSTNFCYANSHTSSSDHNNNENNIENTAVVPWSDLGLTERKDKEKRGVMFLFMWLLCLVLILLKKTEALLIGITGAELLVDVKLFRRDVLLPSWHQIRETEVLTSDSEGGNTTVLVIDTLGAFVDSISFDLTGDVYMMVNDEGTIVWSDHLYTPRDSHQQEMTLYSLHVNLTESIASPSAQKVKVIDTFNYNGDYVAVWRVAYLFDFVDEFIITESWYTYTGQKKPYLYFKEPEIEAQFAPFISKIRYVIIEDVPVPPADWGMKIKLMKLSKDEGDNFWRESYQRLFPRFYMRPSSDIGKRTLVFVSDADEIMNKNTVKRLIQEEQELPLGSSSQFDNIVYLDMFCFYYNFNTVDMMSWRRSMLVSLETYESFDDGLYNRVIISEESKIIPSGGWHLTYFMSFSDIRRKIESFSHSSMVNKLRTLKEDAVRQHDTTSLQEVDWEFCLSIRNAITYSGDLYGRENMNLVPRRDLHNPPESLLPPGWTELQALIEEIQFSGCKCCGTEQ